MVVPPKQPKMIIFSRKTETPVWLYDYPMIFVVSSHRVYRDHTLVLENPRFSTTSSFLAESDRTLPRLKENTNHILDVQSVQNHVTVPFLWLTQYRSSPLLLWFYWILEIILHVLMAAPVNQEGFNYYIDDHRLGHYVCESMVFSQI